jgi:hypothetical protein
MSPENDFHDEDDDAERAERPVSANRSSMKRSTRQEARAKKPSHGGGGIRQRRNKRWTW